MLSRSLNVAVADSWNECHEATGIETSTGYADTFLTDTASWVARFNSTT